jgi:RHS repeat-associated protein
VNEITFLDGSNTKVGYDGAGNMTVMPKVGTPGAAQQNTWDAWNRLVKVMQDATTIGNYAYDGLTRRIAKTVSGEVRHGYFTSQWQLVEERTDANTAADRQFVWGTRYIDDLVLRDKGTERLYATHDQWHVTSVLDAAGVAQERYTYSAFGVSTVWSGTFAGRTISLFGWETRYGAYRWDAETGLYCVRYRYLHPELGRWVSRDPIFENGGLNIFCYVSNTPTHGIDIFGLEDENCPDLKYYNPRPPIGGDLKGCKCEVAKGPSYDTKGPVQIVSNSELKGKLSGKFNFTADFIDEPAKKIRAGCCEVRQCLKWSNDKLRLNFFPVNLKSNEWYEDRGNPAVEESKGRYGHRKGNGHPPNSLPEYFNSDGTPNQISGAHFKSSDQPSTSSSNTGTTTFKLLVVDVCQNSKIVATSDELVVNWG